MSIDTGVRPPQRRRKKNVTPYILLLAPTLILLAGLGYPLFWQIVTSLQEYGLAQQFGQPPTFAGFDNFARIFSDDRLWAVVARSLAFCIFNALATVALGLLIALLMRAVHGGVRIFVQIALLLAWSMPMVAAVTVFRWLFDYRSGVVNWLLSAIGLTQFSQFAWLSHPLTFFIVASAVIIWMSVPFVALSLFAGLTQVPLEVIEAAKIDGASASQMLHYILMPMVRPVLSIVLLLQLIWDLRVFAQIRLLQDAGAPVEETNLLGNFIYELGMGSHDFGAASAVSLFVLALTILISWPYVRSLLKEVDQ
ncbi:MAG: sugar ABC transporter permease [Ancrocorticia sp.]|jgi:N,N'-diacetylchitobiose transport system permease protein|nr:sugar ABC transporter permease [Ancrocorticia sp.]MCI1895736.1 sugar ABC transporter permease [Ancrocorticia sp.]MCI1933353.1 sugar ABC transporter permease [Ancrocorticia sp.]MCI1962997.1 sugar ABC transporter permease [Ancrocorticia sp.]MCI2001365.1 sugar ABC transporter permease [Ancrocorticia sp.]